MKEGKSNVEAGSARPADMWDREARLGQARRIRRRGVHPVSRLVHLVGRVLQSPIAPGNAVFHAYNVTCTSSGDSTFASASTRAPLLSLWDAETSHPGSGVGHSQRRAHRLHADGTGKRQVAAHPDFDPIWSRLNEAGVAVAYHVSEANFMHPLIRAFGEKPLQARRTGQTAWQWMFCYSEIPVQMVLANIVYHNFFERFPNIRIVSAENGANWLPGIPRQDGQDARHGQERILAVRAVEGAAEPDLPAGTATSSPTRKTTSRESSKRSAASECLLMGSDYPHAEGVPTPQDFYAEALRRACRWRRASHHARQRPAIAAEGRVIQRYETPVSCSDRLPESLRQSPRRAPASALGPARAALSFPGTRTDHSSLLVRRRTAVGRKQDRERARVRPEWNRKRSSAATRRALTKKLPGVEKRFVVDAPGWAAKGPGPGRAACSRRSNSSAKIRLASLLWLYAFQAS